MATAPPLLDRNSTLSRVAMHPIDYDKPQFLEPAHAHNPIRVSHIATPPATLAESAPQSFRGALTILQESTSVAFASSKRLQALVGERFHRLVPVRVQLDSAPTEIGDIECAAVTESLNATQNMLKNMSDSEPAFFTYTSQLQSEKRYLLEEALPDWRHKAAKVLQEHSACDTKVLFRSKVETGTGFETWWTKLQEEVDKWLEEAENTVIPDFEDTVAEYRIFQAQEVNTSLARKNGRSWRFKLELEAPEPNMLGVLKTIDSGIEVGIKSGTEDCEFTS